MTLNYSPHDVFIIQRNDSGSAFVETVLHSQPNSVFFFDSGSNISTVNTASLGQTTAGTSSIAVSASMAQSASFLIAGASIYLSQSFIESNINSSVPVFKEGRLYWSKAAHTYVIDTDNSAVDLQIGQESFVRVVAGEAILAGNAVYVNGVSGGLPIIFNAIADGTGTKSVVIGLSSQNLGLGEEGFVTTMGTLENINTFLLNQGVSIYLSSTVPGGLENDPPNDPFEKIVIGIVIFSHPTLGKIFISVSDPHPLNSPYVGMTVVPTFTDNHNQTFTVGSARANFCTTIDGLGEIKTYPVPSVTISASIGTYAQYVFATFNSGSPVYTSSLNKEAIDEIQTIPVFSFIFPFVGGIIASTDWDAAGTLLANKLHQKTIDTDGVQRATGLELNVSSSQYITISSGSIWYGVKHKNLPEINTANTSSSPLSLYSHTGSSWVTNTMVNGKFVNSLYDDGTSLQTASFGSYIVNYVYRAIGTANRTLILLSDALPTLTQAQIFIPPTPPLFFSDFATLVGRIIVQSGSTVPISVDSAFKSTLPLTITPQHNDLTNIQGGTASLNANEYYHLTSASYSRIQNGTLDTASYLNPGATLFVVSSSTQPAYIEPFNLPIVPYNPPFKEGRMFYDTDFHNWVYYTDQDFKLHIGKELIFRIHNPYNTTLTTTTAVYLSGSSPGGSGLPDAYKAIADGTGLHSNTVGIIRSDIPSGSLGYVLTNGVIHDIDVGSFQIGETLWLSPTVPGGLQNIEPGSPNETVRMGTCQEAGSSGSLFIRVITLPFLTNAFAGLTLTPSIIDNGNGTVTVGTASVNLFTDPLGTGPIINYPLTSNTFTVATGSSNYIIAKYATGSATYNITTDQSSINETTVVPVGVLSVVHAEDIHLLTVGLDGLGLANKLQQRTLATDKFAIESGFSLFETGSRNIGITGGRVWYGASFTTSSDFNSQNTASSPVNELHFYYHNGTSNYTNSLVTQYNNSQYDSGSNLQPLTASSYGVNYIYRILGTSNTSTDVSFILGNDQYLTLADAVSATIPSNIPNEITSLGVLVGRIVVQSGSNSAARIDSTLSGQIFLPSAITNHESLTGLQGGAPGQHEHLTDAEYTGTGTGVFVRTNSPILVNATVSGSIFGTITTVGTASFVSLAQTASFVTIAQTASFVSTASFIQTAQSASYVATASFVQAASFITLAQTASFVTTAQSSSYVATASFVQAASFITLAQTASFVQNAISASFAVSSPATTLFTASTYQITASQAISASWAPDIESATASFALSSISASFAPVEIGFSSSVVTQFGTKQDTIVTGNTYQITSSWANNSISASWSPSQGATTLFTASTYQITASQAVSASYAETASFALNAGGSTGTTLTTASTYQITSSWAQTSSWAVNTNATTLFTASFYPITSSWTLFAQTASFAIVTQVTQSNTTSSTSVSSSWASQSLSSSYALFASNSPATTLFTASTYQITASWATNAINGGTQLITASTYQITASWSNNSTSASFALTSLATTLFTASIYQITASWAVISLNANNATTSSFASVASIATTASYANTASVVATSSWATNAITTSYVATSFSRGGTFYDALGLAGSASFSQNVILWRAPVNCVVNNVWGYITAGGVAATASVNARRNGVGTLVTGSNITLTTPNTWVSASSLIAASSSFSIGDKLEIMLISSSGFPTQVAVQVDFTK
jgi:hypothetical protein